MAGFVQAAAVRFERLLTVHAQALGQREFNGFLHTFQGAHRHGAKFAQAAAQWSNCPSGQQGGDLGWLYPGDTVPAFDQAMNALKIGEISNPVQSQFGFHIIQVLERRTTDVSQERQRQRATMALRQLLDAGTLSNLPAGFKAKAEPFRKPPSAVITNFASAS